LKHCGPVEEKTERLPGDESFLIHTLSFSITPAEIEQFNWLTEKEKRKL